MKPGATMTVEVARAAARAADTMGLGGANLLRDAGIGEELLSGVDGRIAPEHVLQMFAHVAARSEMGDFRQNAADALAVPRVGHIAGYLARHSSTLREAWKRLEQYGSVIDANLTFTVVRRKRLTALRRSLAMEKSALLDRLTEVGTVALITMMEGWVGGAIPIHEVRFAHAKTKESMRSFRDVPITYDAGANEVVVFDHFLDMEVADADPWLGTHFEGAARKHLSFAEVGSFRDRVKACIRETLPTSAPTVSSVARRFGMSGRTLQRKLSFEALAFSDLLDEVRRELALVLLREPHVSVYEVAARLGYRDRQAFRNAFVRWMQMTPRDYRMQALRRARPASV